MAKAHQPVNSDTYLPTAVRSVIYFRGGGTQTSQTIYGPGQNYVGDRALKDQSGQPGGDFHHPLPYTSMRVTSAAPRGARSGSEITHGSYSPNPNDIIGNTVFGAWPNGRVDADALAPSDLLYQNVRNMALSQLMSRVRGGSTNLAVDLAELGQTKRMLKDVVKFYRRLQNGPTVIEGVSRRRVINGRPQNYVGGRWKPVSLRALAHFSASEYLKYVYGWSPLMSSIFESAITIMSHGARSDYEIFAGRGKDHSDSTVAYWPPGSSLPHNGTRVNKLSVRCKYVCSYNVKPTATTLLTGLTSLNPLTVAWELVPYSFVVDWFFDVGGYLQNLETAWLWANRFGGGYVTMTYQSSVEIDYHTAEVTSGSYYPGSYWRWSYGAYGVSKRTYKSREILASAPYPTAPIIRVDLGAGKIQHAAGLIAEVVLRRRK